MFYSCEIYLSVAYQRTRLVNIILLVHNNDILKDNKTSFVHDNQGG